MRKIGKSCWSFNQAEWRPRSRRQLLAKLSGIERRTLKSNGQSLARGTRSDWSDCNSTRPSYHQLRVQLRVGLKAPKLKADFDMKMDQNGRARFAPFPFSGLRRVLPAMNFSVASISSFDAMARSALKFVWSTFAIGGRICRSFPRLLTSRFIRHVRTVRVAVASPFDRQTSAVAASMLRRRASSAQQCGTVAFVRSVVAVRVSVTHPHLRNAIAVVRAPEGAARAVPAGF